MNRIKENFQDMTVCISNRAMEGAWCISPEKSGQPGSNNSMKAWLASSCMKDRNPAAPAYFREYNCSRYQFILWILFGACHRFLQILLFPLSFTLINYQHPC